VLGVDVDARMAQAAGRNGVHVEVATFEGWDAAGRTFDAVVAGQTWHWVDPVAGSAKAAGVLRPRGRLSVFWNAGDAPEALADAFAAVYRRLLPDLPALSEARRGVQGYRRFVEAAATGVRGTPGFGPPAVRHYPWEQRYTTDDWVDQLPTSGFFASTPPDTGHAVLEQIRAVVDDHGGAFTMAYTTVVLTAERDSSA
jgi:SAM-dependent methyltransferase